jgi:PAS domain S-box-containing protein
VEHHRKTKAQLMNELEGLRKRVAELSDVANQATQSFETERARADYLQEIIDSVAEGIQVVDKDGIVQFSNRSMEKICGLKHEDLVGKFIGDFYTAEDFQRVAEVAKQLHAMPIGGSIALQYRGLAADGQWHTIETVAVNRLDEPIRGVVGSIRDITNRVAAESGREESEEAIRTVFNSVHDGIIIHDRSGRMEYTNDNALEMFRMTRLDWETMPGADYYYGGGQPLEELNALWDVALGGQPQLLQWECKRPSDGSVFDAEIFLRRIPLKGKDFLLATLRDITERKHMEKQLAASLREKEVLLREIHHRVKNNLALVTSFLRLQERREKEPHVRELLQSAQRRVDSLVVLHEKLYRSDNLADLRSRDYLAGLLDDLRRFYRSVGRGIAVKTEIDDVSFRIDTAIPLGFLLTELFSNCMKHAFPNGRDGEIMVALHALNGTQYELAVADDGVGMPQHVNSTSPHSLGLELVQTFVNQLAGELSIISDQGTTVRIRFTGE